MTLQNFFFFFLVFSQLVRHPPIELLCLSNAEWLWNGWHWVLCNFLCSCKRISFDDPLNWSSSTSNGWLLHFNLKFSSPLQNFLIHHCTVCLLAVPEPNALLILWVVSAALRPIGCILSPWNHMDEGAWCATVLGVMKSRTRLSGFTFTFHFHALEKEMATHSSVLAWRIPGTVEPDGLLSMGSHRVGHNWSNLAAAAYLTYMQSTSWEMLGWRKHKLESRLPGEISITSDMQMTPPLWQKVKKN